MNVGAPELLVVLAVLLLLFGASQLPKLARSIGEAARELRGGLNGDAAARSSDRDPRPE